MLLEPLPPFDIRTYEKADIEPYLLPPGDQVEVQDQVGPLAHSAHRGG
jgi:hypothetical protein